MKTFDVEASAAVPEVRRPAVELVPDRSSSSGSAVKVTSGSKPTLPYYWNGVAGGLAAMASTTCLFPLDTWKTWKMARPHGAQSSRWTFWCIYRGLATKLIFRFPYQLAYQSVYSVSRNHLQQLKKNLANKIFG